MHFAVDLHFSTRYDVSKWQQQEFMIELNSFKKKTNIKHRVYDQVTNLRQILTCFIFD